MDKNQKRGGVIVVNPYAKKKRKRPEGRQHDSPLVLDQATSHRIIKPISTAHNNSTNKNVSAQASALIISASDKAGMEGIDRSKIDAIILRESGNSLYMQQQRRRDEKVNERVRQLQQKLKTASPSEWKPTLELDERLRNYQLSQATRATCVVVDMVGILIVLLLVIVSYCVQWCPIPALVCIFLLTFAIVVVANLAGLGYVLYGLRTLDPTRPPRQTGMCRAGNDSHQQLRRS